MNVHVGIHNNILCIIYVGVVVPMMTLHVHVPVLRTCMAIWNVERANHIAAIM